MEPHFKPHGAHPRRRDRGRQCWANRGRGFAPNSTGSSPGLAACLGAAKLDGMVEDLMAKSGIPGMAVAVVHGGETVYAKGFGVRFMLAFTGRHTLQ